MVRRGISKLAVVETQEIEANVTIHEFAIVRKGVTIGKNVVIHPHVVIESGVTLGERVEVFPGTYLGKIPKGAGALTRQPIFKHPVSIGSATCVGPNAIVYCDVQIGKDSLIGDGASIREQCKIGSSTVIGRSVTLNYAVIVGSFTKIMDHSWLAGNMIVGDNVFISGGVLTANDNAIGKAGYTDQSYGPEIQDGAMIGVGAILLPGVLIGRNAIVAAGSVVTRDVAPGTLVMGTPAQVVKRLAAAKG